jgi:hypothetical protein
MAPDSDQELVTRLMDRANREGRRLGELSDGDLRTPVLVIVDELGRESLVVLHVPGVHPSDAMKVTLVALKARAAAICFEGWEVYVEPPAEIKAEWQRTGRMPEGADRIAMGVPPSKHPDRFETLTVIGQVKGRPVTRWGWKIRRPAGRPRQFEWMDFTDMTELPSKFNPLFAPDEEVRTLVREHVELQRLRNDVQARRS